MQGRYETVGERGAGGGGCEHPGIAVARARGDVLPTVEAEPQQSRPVHEQATTIVAADHDTVRQVRMGRGPGLAIRCPHEAAARAQALLS